jgi:hypothetical protein
MLKDIIDSVVDKLEDSGIDSVYSAFDAEPVEGKGRGIFTVVGIGSFESSTPIFTQYSIYLPFKTEIEIKVTAPDSGTVEQIYTYYDEHIEPVIMSMTGLNCTIKKFTVKFDSNIQRLVLTACFAANGISKTERCAS